MTQMIVMMTIVKQKMMMDKKKGGEPFLPWKEALTRISHALGTPAGLISGKKCSGSVQDHVELYRQKDAALLADVRFMSVCST